MTHNHFTQPVGTQVGKDTRLPVEGRFIGGPYDGVRLGMAEAPEMVEVARCPACDAIHAWLQSPADSAVAYALTEHDKDSEPQRARYEQPGVKLPKPRPGVREKVHA